MTTQNKEKLKEYGRTIDGIVRYTVYILIGIVSFMVKDLYQENRNYHKYIDMKLNQFATELAVMKNRVEQNEEELQEVRSNTRDRYTGTMAEKDWGNHLRDYHKQR